MALLQLLMTKGEEKMMNAVKENLYSSANGKSLFNAVIESSGLGTVTNGEL